MHIFLQFARIFTTHNMLYRAKQGLTSALLLSLIPKDYDLENFNPRKAIEMFKDMFYLSTHRGETTYDPRNPDFLVEKLIRTAKHQKSKKKKDQKPQKLTNLEYQLLFVLFLKLHKNIDDHQNSCLRLTFLVDLNFYEENKYIQIARYSSFRPSFHSQKYCHDVDDPFL